MSEEGSFCDRGRTRVNLEFASPRHRIKPCTFLPITPLPLPPGLLTKLNSLEPRIIDKLRCCLQCLWLEGRVRGRSFFKMVVEMCWEFRASSTLPQIVLCAERTDMSRQRQLGMLWRRSKLLGRRVGWVGVLVAWKDKTNQISEILLLNFQSFHFYFFKALLNFLLHCKPPKITVFVKWAA